MKYFFSIFLLFGLVSWSNGQNAVTILVNMSEQAMSPDGAHIAGSFQGWNPSSSPLSDLGGGIYGLTIDVADNTELQFKFINGLDWPFQEVVPAECGINDGFGGFNRSFTITSGDATFGPVCFGGCTDCGIVVEPIFVNATFIVNMSNEIVSNDGVHIAGSFQGWNPSTTALSDLGNGLYSITAEVEMNQEVQFKFINGIDWPFQESIPAECGASDGFGGFNRSLTIGEEDVTFGPICFSSCADCDVVVEPETVMVLFQVNMSNEAISPQGVHLAGNFQGWNPNATVMTDIGGGNFEILYEVPANQTAEFRFINGSEWINAEMVPSECGVENGFGEFIRTLEVGSENSVFGPVCFGECENCQPTIPVMVIFQVDMTNETVSPDGVYVAGNFNNWDATATSLAPNGDGTYQAVAFVNSGTNLQYKFINGSDWAGAESVPSECGLNDGSGNINRSIQVESTAVTTPLVCFGTCSPCEFIPVVNVTFVVNMGNEAIDGNGVHIAGTFNDFSATASQMNNIGSGLYSFTATVGQNEQIFYKFINGNDFANVEQVPFECGQNDGFGGYNRTIVTNAVDFTVNTVCFGSCADCTVSVENLEQINVAIFPNPAQESITIQGLENQKLSVINTSGELVMLIPQGRHSNVAIENLAKGLYFIKSEQGKKVGVFIKK